MHELGFFRFYELSLVDFEIGIVRRYNGVISDMGNKLRTAAYSPRNNGKRIDSSFIS